MGLGGFPGRAAAGILAVALTAACTPLLAAVPAAATVTSSAQADHWGTYFGDDTASDSDWIKSPAAIDLPAPIAQLGTSNSTQYALLTDGTLWAWGQGTNGELGNGADESSFTTPVQVQFPPGVSIASIPSDAMPYDTALAVDTSGNVWGWGLNLKGELCLGTDTSYDTPQLLPLTDVTALAGANGHAVYDSAGTVYTCGADTYGLLGNGAQGKAGSDVPVQVTGLPAGEPVTSLVSAFGNDGALLANGTYYDWGMNTSGQLGTGSTKAHSAVPVQVSFADSAPVTEVAQGGSTAKNGQTLVMLADGSLYAWGADAYGQLGDGGTASQFAPIPLVPPANVTYSTLASAGATCYAVDTGGNVWAWGMGTKDQIGNGQAQSQPRPVMVDSGASMISATANDVVVAGDSS